MSENFEKARKKITEIISGSKTEEDPGHSENAREWLLKLKPDADEILQLAILGHDIERALPDRLQKEQFENYDDYKTAHAERAGKLLAEIVKDAGYNENDARRIETLVGEAEFSSENPDVRLISDTDSISYFDYNIEFYLKRNGPDKTKEKIRFMYERCSQIAKENIDNLMNGNQKITPVFREAISSH